MTVFANICRLHMQRTLAGCVSRVVAANAVIHNIGMVEIRRYPGHRRVTVIASVAAGNMGRVFADSRDAIVAGVAGSADLCVIDRVGGYPDVRCMAIFTNIRGLNVSRILACRVGAIVAAGTISRDVHVIEIRRQPAKR